MKLRLFILIPTILIFQKFSLAQVASIDISQAYVKKHKIKTLSIYYEKTSSPNTSYYRDKMKMEYIFNLMGLAEKVIRYDKDTVIYYITNEYNSKGQSTFWKKIFVKNPGCEAETITWNSMDTIETRVHQEYTKTTDTSFFEVDYQYDAKKNRTRDVIIRWNNHQPLEKNISSNTSYELVYEDSTIYYIREGVAPDVYRYNSKGKLVYREYCIYGNHYLVYSYTYHPDGNLKTEHLLSTGVGYHSDKTFDEEGLLLQEIYHPQNSRDSSIHTYTYYKNNAGLIDRVEESYLNSNPKDQVLDYTAIQRYRYTFLK